MTILPPLRLAGATALVGGELTRRPLALAGGRMAADIDGLPEVDLTGFMILPGIVDIHSTSLPRHLCPRPGARLPLDLALSAMDAEAVAHGVTTQWIAQGWSWAGGRLGPDQAEAMADALERYDGRANLRLQILAETHLADCRERLLRLIEGHGVDSVIFANALPDAIVAAARASHKLTAWAEAEDIAIEDYIERLRAAKDREAEVPRRLLALAKAFDKLGVTYGSYDDADGETREQFRMMGARLALCPVRAGAARVARANGDPIVLDASELTRGGIRPGAVSAQALLSKGLCDALASRDHPASLAAAAFALIDSGQRSLSDAWAMISDTPARIMGVFDRGDLSHGQRADLVVIDPVTRRIEATLVAGRIAHLTGGAALRFLDAAPRFALAAE
ncbi:alpha-D-ribose 1-methylphosphonate 5-triphosphate diphosphatase [Maritimibacter sp. DP1N21-5]|uniref:alpha-D-ribose 1-methylphosphonate 5-triphosphate diphosphatase n=1 Tax=Maritimibacter sp. DP1N21-5 TaxID=2836867 RepID=UPI001C461E03|nr:alpha-D-ribose 1-methylphosphonate 5-triphosphate diphosphatase [Maritimibacter sp. DP1N21-5]MBV7407988.1 alpha-D-ribose 1-methylphosphonate 5-triphosphate diphosphatase [Maritimibacter sp. DP1N21-5]